MPPDLQPFFTASTSAGAALVGLLFVAISIRPDDTLGPAAAVERRVLASGAFAALADAFFTSLGGLVPLVNVGAIAILAGAVNLAGTTRRHRELFKATRQPRHIAVFVASLGLYALQVIFGVTLLQDGESAPALSRLAGLIVVVYVVGLGRAWELLGAERRGLAGVLTPLTQRQADEQGAASEQEP